MECSRLKCYYYSDFLRTLKLPIKWKSNNWPYWIVTFCNLFRNAENCAKIVLLRQNLICYVVSFQKPRAPCSHTQKNNSADWLPKPRKTLEVRAKAYGSRLSKGSYVTGLEKYQWLRVGALGKAWSWPLRVLLKNITRQVITCFYINHLRFPNLLHNITK